MSQAGQDLTVALCLVALSAVLASVAFREESEAWAWVGVLAFFSCSLLAAWFLWGVL